MGMYTHLVLNVNLRKDTPKEVIDTIKYMVSDSNVEPPKQDHDLFSTDRWAFCLNADSAYFMGSTSSSFVKEYDWDDWELTVNSNCKNYCQEYQKFLDYIQPYIDEFEYLGFIRYEDELHPTLIYNTTEVIEYVHPDVKLVGKVY